MNRQHILVKTLPIAAVIALITTLLVRGWAEANTFLCDESRCAFDAASTWLPSGVTIVSPFIAVLGFMFARRLHYRDRLGPFSHRAIPDSEQILEVLSVLGAGALSYWVLRNGPTIEAVDIGRINVLAADILGENDVPSLLVPDGRSWFAVGAILSAPFAFSLGSMLGREWYGRKRRKAQDQLATTDHSDGDGEGDDFESADDEASTMSDQLDDAD
jgi:hypothetical protein